MAGAVYNRRTSKPGEPVWEVARFYPMQGDWSEEIYLGLETNHLIEFDHGSVEFLPMPSFLHQRIVRLLVKMLQAWADGHGGEAISAPMPLKIADGTYREPDVMYVRTPIHDAAQLRHLPTAELVMEVVSEGDENRKRDYVDKRAAYAAAGIPEYWIVDPIEKRVTVLTLKDGKYAEHCVAKPGAKADSIALKGFELDCADVFPKK
jgi:Uma2 family endonuclease